MLLLPAENPESTPFPAASTPINLTTFNCCQCHDHKYDPISHGSTSQFRAFFEPLELRQDRVPGEPDPALSRSMSTGRRTARSPRAWSACSTRSSTPRPSSTPGASPQPHRAEPAAVPQVPKVPRGPSRSSVEPVRAGPRSFYPGLHPFVRTEDRGKAQTVVSKQRPKSTRPATQQELHGSRSPISAPVATARHRRQSPTTPEALLPAPRSRALDAQARSDSNEAKLASAEAQLASLDARIAADDAKYGSAAGRTRPGRIPRGTPGAPARRQGQSPRAEQALIAAERKATTERPSKRNYPKPRRRSTPPAQPTTPPALH